jgi:hypothetical protein
LEFGEPSRGVDSGWLNSCKCILLKCGWVLLVAVAVMGGYKHLVPKLFFWWGVVPEFDYFKKFQVFYF